MGKNFYYECINNYPKRHICKTGLIFSNEQKRCIPDSASFGSNIFEGPIHYSDIVVESVPVYTKSQLNIAPAVAVSDNIEEEEVVDSPLLAAKSANNTTPTPSLSVAAISKPNVSVPASNKTAVEPADEVVEEEVEDLPSPAKSDSLVKVTPKPIEGRLVRKTTAPIVTGKNRTKAPGKTWAEMNDHDT